jgi:hypothetical protein
MNDTLAIDVFRGSNGGKTRSYLSSLEKLGQSGRIASALFRVLKSSARAKKYRSGTRTVSFSELEHGRESESLKELCKLLQADSSRIAWGWQQDPNQDFAKWVLYVDLPHGQVRFHSTDRIDGPEYSGAWDGSLKREDHILDFCDSVLGNTERAKARKEQEKGDRMRQLEEAEQRPRRRIEEREQEQNWQDERRALHARIQAEALSIGDGILSGIDPYWVRTSRGRSVSRVCDQVDQLFLEGKGSAEILEDVRKWCLARRQKITSVQKP